jgi:hypothetical protein
MNALGFRLAGLALAAITVVAAGCKNSSSAGDTSDGSGTTTTTSAAGGGGTGGGSGGTGHDGQGTGGEAAGGSGGAGASGGAGGAAGAGGATAQAPTCAEYCKYVTLNCHDVNAMYKDEATCLANCPAIPVGSASDLDGNSLGCRIHHAHAALDLPSAYCTPAGPGGDGVCGTNCEGFCQLAMEFCPETWSDAAACAQDCATFDPSVWYSANVVTGNSLACRMFYATMAAVDPTHCAAIKKESATCL